MMNRPYLQSAEDRGGFYVRTQMLESQAMVAVHEGHLFIDTYFYNIFPILIGLGNGRYLSR